MTRPQPNPPLRPAGERRDGVRHLRVAILWASRDALHSPPLHGTNNKILWVSRISFTGDPLVIKATLAGGTRTATVSVPGGPGPSIIDLPAPGCWTLHLSWSGHSDELKLRYAP